MLFEIELYKLAKIVAALGKSYQIQSSMKEILPDETKRTANGKTTLE
jgi:hypothetical protein